MMKKLIAMALAVMLVLSCTVAAFAVQNVTNGKVMEDGTITITGANENYDYAVYKLLHMDTCDTDTGVCTYKVEDAWAGFFATQEALTYVSIDGSGNVSQADGFNYVLFGKATLDYAKANGIAPEAVSSDGTGVFTGLSLGYYLVDAGAGILCSLSIFKPDGHIVVKNSIPVIDKNVQEDSHVGTGTAEYGSSNTADIGQEVNFDITIYAQAGAENYVYHDMMDAGLEMKAGSLEVIHHCGNVTNTLAAGVDYIFVENPADCDLEDWNCSFEIQFTKEFLDTVKSNDKIYVRYTAVLTDEAVIGGDGNHNAGELTYGDNHKTTVDSTTTYTYGFEIFNIDSKDQPLQGAEFKLLDSNKEEITLAYNSDTGEYRRATSLGEHEDWCENTVVVSDASGIAKIVGLDNGTYYLHQTKAPDGYAMLSDDREFSITDSDLFVEYDGDKVLEGSSVCLINPQGTTLPDDPTDETTTPSTNEEKKSQSENTETDNSIVPVLIAVIAVLVAVILVAGVVLIAKKRKSA